MLITIIKKNWAHLIPQILSSKVEMVAKLDFLLTDFILIQKIFIVISWNIPMILKLSLS